MAGIDPHWLVQDGSRPWRSERERELALAYPGHVVRHGSLLALKLENGRFAWLVDVDGPGLGGFGCCESYRLSEFWPGQGTYAVEVNQGEAWWYWLVSARTADVTVIAGPPRQDPQTPGLLASVLSSDLGGFRAEVWEQQQGEWRRSYLCQQLAYGTGFVRWDGPGRALLHTPDPSGTRREHLLARQDGVWATTACQNAEAPSR